MKPIYCTCCDAPVVLERVAAFGWSADRRMKSCRTGDDVYGWVDLRTGDSTGCQGNPNMHHSVKGLITEVRRGTLVVGRTRKG